MIHFSVTSSNPHGDGMSAEDGNAGDLTRCLAMPHHPQYGG